MPDNFESVAGSLNVIGSQIHHLEETSSTMDDAWNLARSGAPEGAVVIADVQSAGRGRYDRSWVSRNAQDILCSVILRPRVSLVGELLMIAALSVSDVAISFGIENGIKWPNDVQVNGLKLAGVIAESKTGPDAVAGDAENSNITKSYTDHATAVIGIGLNVNLDPECEPSVAAISTSLSRELITPVDRFDVFKRLLEALDTHYSSINLGNTALTIWRERLTTIGRTITVASGNTGTDDSITGIARDVDRVGRLIVQDENGRDWPISAGEVTVRSIE